MVETYALRDAYGGWLQIVTGTSEQATQARWAYNKADGADTAVDIQILSMPASKLAEKMAMAREMGVPGSQPERLTR
jgi:hypothetical protein